MDRSLVGKGDDYLFPQQGQQGKDLLSQSRFPPHPWEPTAAAVSKIAWKALQTRNAQLKLLQAPTFLPTENHLGLTSHARRPSVSDGTITRVACIAAISILSEEFSVGFSFVIHLLSWKGRQIRI